MYKLLIADDEALEREGLELMIRHLIPDKFEFLHAGNGRKAIQLAEEHRPDMIFMDIKMPGIQGLEAVRQIREKLPSAQIVMITAHDYFAYAKEGLLLGVRDYLLKPARREEVAEVLRKLMAVIGEERRRRNEQLELQEKLAHLLPLAENELTLMLMLEHVQDLEPEQLAGLLELHFSKGYAMVLSFPGTGRAAGRRSGSPSGRSMRRSSSLPKQGWAASPDRWPGISWRCSFPCRRGGPDIPSASARWTGESGSAPIPGSASACPLASGSARSVKAGTGLAVPTAKPSGYVRTTSIHSVCTITMI